MTCSNPAIPAVCHVFGHIRYFPPEKARFPQPHKPKGIINTFPNMTSEQKQVNEYTKSLVLFLLF